MPCTMPCTTRSWSTPGWQYFLATVNGRDTETVGLLALQVMSALKRAW
jgi:hypothetical protein